MKINAIITDVKVNEKWKLPVIIRFRLFGDSKIRYRRYSKENIYRFLRNFKVKSYDELIGQGIYADGNGYTLGYDGYRSVFMLYSQYIDEFEEVEIETNYPALRFILKANSVLKQYYQRKDFMYELDEMGLYMQSSYSDDEIYKIYKLGNLAKIAKHERDNHYIYSMGSDINEDDDWDPDLFPNGAWEQEANWPDPD